MFDAVQPLISQPIVEFCLRTPSYIFGAGGVDRALEREAFRDVLPEEVYRRHLKGFINHHLTHDIAENANALCEFLSEGRLVASGLVERKRVLDLFDGSTAVSAASLEPILSLLAAEAWVTTWQT